MKHSSCPRSVQTAHRNLGIVLVTRIHPIAAESHVALNVRMHSSNSSSEAMHMTTMLPQELFASC